MEVGRNERSSGEGRRWFVRGPAAGAEQPAADANGTARQSCDGLRPDATTTLAETRAQIGAHDAGVNSAGTGVAVTGVNPGLGHGSGATWSGAAWSGATWA